jgi:WD40-like Beta Propeller Repeat
VRRLDQNEARALAGTETANQCFFSPDGRSLAFITSDRTLKTISIADGLVAVVARGVDRNNGSAWGADGRLTIGRSGVLWQFSADGTSPTQLTKLDVARQEFLQMWPMAVDQGRTVLFTSVTGATGQPRMRIEAVMTATGERRPIVDSASYPMVMPSGHLVFFRDGGLVAASFDEKRLTIMGTPVRVVNDVALDSLGAPLAAVSRSGALVYVSSKTSASRLVWVSQAGVESPAFDTPRMYEYPRIAPSGRQIAVAASGAVWVLDSERATSGLLAPATSLGSSYGTWTSDGRRLIFRTATGLSVAHADSTAAPEFIAQTSAADFPNDVSPDGTTLILTRQTSETSGDVYKLSLQGPSAPEPLINTPAYEGGGQLSSDGKWLLYTSDESGRFEVYLRPYPGLEQRWPVSTQGGTHARWSPDGQHIFFRQGNRMFSVSMTVRPQVMLSQPKLLFDQHYAFGPAITFANYDVAPDGQRFLMIRNDTRSGRLNVVLNWAEELKRLVPPK